MRIQKNLFTRIGLLVSDLFSAVAFLFLSAIAVSLGLLFLTALALGACLIFELNIAALIPLTPYWCGALFGVSMLSLSALSLAGLLYFCSLMRQMRRVYRTFRHNVMAERAGVPALPPVPLAPTLGRGTRLLFQAAPVLLAAFCVSFLAGLIASALSAGVPQFWHVWGWFI